MGFIGWRRGRKGVARYRTKDPPDLVWNRIRRQITRDLDTAISNWREEKLNDLLDGAFREYVKGLETGNLVEVEAKYSALIDAIVSDLAAPKELEGVAKEAA